MAKLVRLGRLHKLLLVGHRRLAVLLLLGWNLLALDLFQFCSLILKPNLNNAHT